MGSRDGRWFGNYPPGCYGPPEPGPECPACGGYLERDGHDEYCPWCDWVDKVESEPLFNGDEKCPDIWVRFPDRRQARKAVVYLGRYPDGFRAAFAVTLSDAEDLGFAFQRLAKAWREQEADR